MEPSSKFRLLVSNVFSYPFVFWRVFFRYHYSAKTRYYCWRFYHSWMSLISCYWILPGTCYYACTLRQEAAKPHIARNHFRWPRSLGQYLHSYEFTQINLNVGTSLKQVDLLRTVTLPLLQLFGVSEGLELRVSELVCMSFSHIP